jgi:predicted TIM-barrel fold metal-dependent hydrolase
VKIIDAHLHLSPTISEDPRICAAELDDKLAAANISRAVVLHLLNQPWKTSVVWSAEQVAEALARFPRLHGFVNIDPMTAEAGRQLQHGKEQLGFIGLKLHPRLQKFDMLDPKVSRLIALAGEMQLPVLIDAFPDGDWLFNGFSPLAFAKVARECPRTRIIIAHLGGHHCIDFMMLAKRIPNIWFDLSYSLLYYAGSAVVANLMYCCKSLRYDRVFYGSDYPDRPVDLTLEMSLKVFEEHGVKDQSLDALLWKNAADFYGWTDI